MRKFLPVVLSGAMAVSFSQIAFAQTTYSDSNPSDNNTRYNIHQRGDQNSTQFGTDNQSSQIEGSGNQVNQRDGEAAGGTSAGDDDDDRRGNRGKGNKGKNTNKGWHKGWDDPASSGSTRY